MPQDFVRQLGPDDTFQRKTTLLQYLHIDSILFAILLCICLGGLIVLYSASDRNTDMVIRQAVYMAIGFIIMLIIAQIPSAKIQYWVPLLYVAGLCLLLVVFVAGTGAKGATRWIALPGFRFQPSEILKLLMPLTIATYLNKYPVPCSNKQISIALILTAIPVVLVAKQPDLGTSLLIASSAAFVLFLAGFRLRYLVILLVLALPVCWSMWNFIMHDYQKQRVLTFLNPERDPLGAGWHIIQAKIAIGSGGVYGKGFLNGSQSHLDFLPESHTDFIFAVIAEELGLIGVCILLLAYILLIGRGIYIAMNSQSTFNRLAAGGIILTFSVYVIVNIGMVSGLLPVVGVPLPLISRGGTSIISMMAGFGVLMSIQTHKHLIPR